MPAESDLMGLDVSRYGDPCCSSRSIAHHEFSRRVLAELDADDEEVGKGIFAGVFGLIAAAILIGAPLLIVGGLAYWFLKG